MRLRATITVLALLGVLVHALAVVRHSTVVMLAAATVAEITATGPAADSLEAAPICHASQNGASQDGANAPSGPMPSGSKLSCPICLGLASAVALAPAAVLLPRPVCERPLDRFAVDDERVRVHERIRPPSRGPPSLA